MQVFAHGGICVSDGKGAVYLDPSRGRPDGVVTHAHSDHLRPRTHMTPATAEVMHARTVLRRDLGRAVIRPRVDDHDLVELPFEIICDAGCFK